VGVSQLQAADQLDLFHAPTPNAASPLDSTIDAIRARFGPGALTRARRPGT
jgi:hypothetical protein